MRKLLLFLVAIIAIFCFISCNQDVETKTYTVTFNANGADSGTAPSAIQVQEGKSFTIPSQGTLLKSGYDFVGWNTKSDGSGEVFAIFQSVNVTRDMKLFAVWKEHSDEPDISDDDSGVVYESLVFSYLSESDSYSVSVCRNKGITTIVIPSEHEGKPITEIGVRAFRDCTSLTMVTIPSSVILIEDYAFEDCENLSIMFAEGMESIPSRALSNASGVVSVTMPESVTSIGEYAFSGCSGLTDIVYLGTKTQWNSMQKGVSWDFSTGNYTVHCTDGDLAKN